MNNKLVSIKSKDVKEFYKQYLELINPFFNMSERERSVIVLVMYYAHIYRKIEDPEHRMMVVFSTNCRADIREELDLTKEYFNNLIFKLRKKGILKGNHINENIYTALSDDNTFELKFRFHVSEQSE